MWLGRHAFSLKNTRNCRGWRERHRNLQPKWSSRAISTVYTTRGWRERHINLQSKWSQHEAHAQFIRYTQRFRRGWRERHIINLQSKWSQHEAHAQFIRYTQRFRRGWRERHINVQSKWSPRHGRDRITCKMYNHIEPKTCLTWENTRNLEGLLRRVFSLEQDMEIGSGWPHHM